MKEDTLLRKLIADGEGIGEDRRVQQVSTFFRESRSAGSPKVVEAVKVFKALELLELSMQKQKKIAAMNRKESEEFNQLAGDIDKQIELMYQKMEEAKHELADAKIVKRNRQEYRKLVKVVEKTPSRSETTRKLEEIRDELLRQHERQKVLESKLADRRNHLQAFNIILSNFRRFVAEDEDDENPESTAHENEEEDDAVSVDKHFEDLK